MWKGLDEKGDPVGATGDAPAGAGAEAEQVGARSASTGGLVGDGLRSCRDDRRSSASALLDPDLPGYDDLVAKGARQFEGASEVDALKYLYREDVRQQKFKVLSRCLHLNDPHNTGSEVVWTDISNDLREYAEAMGRWQTFERSAHSHGFRARTVERKTVLLAARRWASTVYEERCAVQIEDLDAARAALAEEKKAIAQGLRSLPIDSPSAYMLAAAERKSGNAAAVTCKEAEALHRSFWARRFMALFGVVTLGAPMLIMSLYDTRTTSLAIMSVFTVVVASLLAWFMKTMNAKDMIGAAAAYVAALVVFVGTANPNSKGLSKGAIAGIVLAVLVGKLVLMVLRTLLGRRSLIDGLMALFGPRKRINMHREVLFEEAGVWHLAESRRSTSQSFSSDA